MNKIDWNHLRHDKDTLDLKFKKVSSEWGVKIEDKLLFYRHYNSVQNDKIAGIIAFGFIALIGIVMIFAGATL